MIPSIDLDHVIDLSEKNQRKTTDYAKEYPITIFIDVMNLIPVMMGKLRSSTLARHSISIAVNRALIEHYGQRSVGRILCVDDEVSADLALSPSREELKQIVVRINDHLSKEFKDNNRPLMHLV
jgi:hypothetical protein